ncbi:hypothetical protein GOBAR_AA23264 [Gossypium barbadense]|uniref:Transmembrane protein n=1 Tax=Gossypium barbadense TaxID=3634 RepID=A0A2P5X245_GOSBA|nr:hypothetical protein GOBAR_AA23264 [Gossypium barbadense]
MSEDPQKLKKIAAAAYDYENDPRWADYWSNILIPPHMASRSDVVDHFKRKFYQRYIFPDLLITNDLWDVFHEKDPDLVVEAMSSSAQTGSAKPTSSSASSLVANGEARAHSAGSTARTSGPSAGSGSNTTSLHWDRHTIQFSVNAWVFIVAVLAIFPLVPKSLSNRAYRLSFIGTACSSVYSLYALYGRPRAWTLQDVQYDELIWTFTAVALIPILCRSVERIAKFLRHNFSRSTLYKYLEDPCVWVESNTTTLSILSSHAEIGLGWLLLVSLFSWQRNIVQTFMYWQLLKLMYHSPVSAGYHQSVWAKIGRTINPLILRYVPFLNTPVSAIQKWWSR